MSGFVMNSIARAVPNVVGSFHHRFGGTPAHRGIKPRSNSQPLHLLYTFDTKDPLVPVRVAGARYLPLYYCFPYSAGGVGYRVVSDEEIKILYLETKNVEPDFPYKNYPNEFLQLFRISRYPRFTSGMMTPALNLKQSSKICPLCHSIYACNRGT